MLGETFDFVNNDTLILLKNIVPNVKIYCISHKIVV